MSGLATVCLTIAIGSPRFDLDIAHEAGSHLLAGGWDVYAAFPDAQMGPLALAAAALLPPWGYALTVAAAQPVLLALVFCSVARISWPLLVGTSLLLPFPWALFGVLGHADDALVAAAGAGMVLAIRARRPVVLVLLFVMGCLGKPTALFLLPLAFGLGPAAGVSASVFAGLAWAPFVLQDARQFLEAGTQGFTSSWAYSVPWWLFGGVSEYPSWWKPVQLAVVLVVGSLALRYRGAAACFLAVLVARTLLEPATWAYYHSSCVVAAAVAEVCWRRRLPFLTAATFVAVLLTTPNPPLDLVPGVARTALLVTVLAFAFVPHGTRLPLPWRARHGQDQAKPAVPSYTLAATADDLVRLGHHDSAGR